MEAEAGLLLMFITVSHGVESFCDGRQDGAQCFGALGGTVTIQLMDDVSEINRFQLIKEKSVILLWINNQIISNTIADRSSFNSSNGTFRITNLNKEDSGQYKLQTFDSSGSRTGIRTLQFTVEAGVSSLQLVSECLSEGQKKVSCSSEGGDSPQYSWTLDGHTLIDSELVSGNNQTNIIVLRRNISGRLICSVRNQVSESFKEENISTCEFINCTSNGTHISGWVFEENKPRCDEPATVFTTEDPVSKSTESNKAVSQTELNLWPVMAGVLLSGLVVSVVGTAVVCAKRKTTNTEVEEDDEELTYSSVTIGPQQQRTDREQSVESEYTQVKFLKKPHRTGPTVTECVYSEILKREVI